MISGPGVSGKPSERATTCLVIGILSIVCCKNLAGGVAAIIISRAELDAIARGEADPAGKNYAQIGFALGIIGLIVGVVALYRQFNAVGMLFPTVYRRHF